MTYPKQFLSELGLIQTGSTPSTSEASYWGGEVPFVTPSELDQCEPVSQAQRTLSESGAQQSRLLPKGTVMVCCIGSLGKIGIAGRTVVTNQQINSVEFNTEKIWPKYGYYACKRLRPKLLSMAPATTISIVSKSKFGQLEIPVPPLHEQRRIAEILDHAVALNLKRSVALQQLELLKKAIYIEMFGNPLKNASRWPVQMLKDLGKVVTGRTPSSSMDGMFGGSIPFVTPGDLGSDEAVKRTLTQEGAAEVVTVRAGATLVCCIGTVGKLDKLATRSAFNQQINAVEWSSTVDDDFGFHSLSFFKSHLASKAASTTVPILNKSAFEKLLIPVPPLPLQRDFARKIDAVSRLANIYRHSLKEHNGLLSSLEERSFSGSL